ncbi:hypothetical protein NPIL_168011 [Nephila pilipes]|uniref:AF4/FMR2 family member lilli n=1 Tax=Nephila pilipes TaxID=299642 RepID=A0A8X6MTY9_NEPPI|nr:hypothetical protein NPIL_168011 [Nephila pilipes]
MVHPAMLKSSTKKAFNIVDVHREREQERRARLQLLDDIRDPSPTPIFGEPVKVDREDETSIRIKNTLGDFTQVLVNDPKNLIGISRSNSSSHLMNGHPSNGYQSSGHAVNGYSMSSGGHSTASHQNSGYSSNSHSGSGHGSSGIATAGLLPYNRPPIVKKPPPPYVVNGGGVQKSIMPNYISPKAPDKRQSYNRPDKVGHYKPDSPAAAVAKNYHSSNTQQLPYYGQDNRPKDPASWDKDQRRTNSTNPSQPVAVNISVNVESSTNLTINNINVNNNSISTSAPIWNCGPDTPAVQIAPFHLPSSATPSNPAKIAPSYGQTSTSYSNPLSIKHETQNNTPAKRNQLRPSSLKLQPERKSIDAPIPVETILKEMTKVVPSAPLTAIQTPRTEETGFAFPTNPKDEESSFIKLEDPVHLLTPLDDDPMPNDVRQSSPNSWWPSPDIKPEMKYSQTECKVTDSATYELSKQWKIPGSIVSPKITPAPDVLIVAPPEPVQPLSSEPAQKTAEIEANKYVSSSLQDDLEMSDSDEEAVPEVKSNPEQFLTKSPVAESNSTLNETSTVSTKNNTAMDTNSTESSNSSSDSSGDSDSDDSSSESNDSDSSSEASDEEISSKKWGLSNFVDESQRIHSPAFFQNDAASKESFRLHAERIKNFGLNSVNPLNGTTTTQDNLPSTTIVGATFLVPDVPVTNKSNLLSPIPSPVHPTVGPRTPPSPSCPPKQNFPDAIEEVDPTNPQIDNKSSEDNDSAVQNNSPHSNEPEVNCDASEEKSNSLNEKCKKQLRSGKAKADEATSELESSHNDSCVDETSDPKELSDKSLDNDKLATGTEKTADDSVSPNVTESSPENYSIKTRQRVSAASSAKKLKANTDNSSENNQKPDVGIAKLKHPRACRKSNEKQTKKPASTIASAKSDSEESKKLTKQDAKDAVCEKKEPVKTTLKAKTIPKARAQSKALKSSPRQATEAKKTEVKKKRKKFSMENFLQSPETENARLSNTLPPFSPSPERSPIPDCPNTSSEAVEESPTSPVVPCKTLGRPTGKGGVKGKKVEKLRRSVRCSERASINAQTEVSATSQTNSENTKNTKNVGKAKRNIENLSISIEPPVELLSPIPQDPPPATTPTTKISDSAIPRKIMVCIPLAKLSRLPVPVQQDQDSALRQPVKSTPTADVVRTQKKDSVDKPNVNVTPKCSQSKDLNEKAKPVTSVKNKNNTKNALSNKKAKVIKPPNETPAKPNTVTDVNKIVKGKDKLPGDTAESKFPKKRKGEIGEKLNAKKTKLSSRTAEERKKDALSSKSDAASNQLENPGKSKGLERCDSTGSLSSLCSQQSQRSSKYNFNDLEVLLNRFVYHSLIMEQLLKPERFDIDPTCSNAETKWRHWKKTFENFLGGIKTLTEENKLPLLSNYVTSNVYQFINDCTTYTGAIAILDSLFIKKRNVIFARHCLSTRNQQTEETVSEYLQVLNQLSKDCDFTDVKAEEYRKEYVRDAFIRGLKCPRIRQRLLENTSMTLDQAFEQARTLESAEVHAASYMGNSFPVQSAAMKTDDFSEETLATSAASSSSRSQKCFFCGNDLHSRTICPARDSSKEKKDYSACIPESKRIKTSVSSLLSVKDMKKEKEDKPSKNCFNLDARLQLDKNKIKLRDKATVKDMTDTVQIRDDCSSLCCDDQCKDDGKAKVGGSSQNLDIGELTDWENFAPEMHKELKGGSNKHSNQAPIMPMDYYWTEARKQLSIAEKEKDPFQQAVKFFEAVVLVILTSQQREEYSKDTDAVYQFYSVTLTLTDKLLSKIKKLQSCPGSTEFKLLILCLKSQSLLNVKHYNLKIKEVKEELDTVNDFLKLQSSASLNHSTSQASHQSRLTSLTNVPSPHSPIPSPASTVTSQNSNGTVNVPQSVLDMICRQHTHLVNLHKGHDLWEQADMYMTRSNLREFFKEVADQSEPLTLHSSITELVKYIQKGISLVKKSLR